MPFIQNMLTRNAFQQCKRFTLCQQSDALLNRSREVDVAAKDSTIHRFSVEAIPARIYDGRVHLLG